MVDLMSLDPNLSPLHLKQFATRLGLKVAENGLPAGLTPEDIFHYIYAVFHSPGYRSRYAEYLKNEFPRLPLTTYLDLFRALAQFGKELVALHLLKSSKVGKSSAEFFGDGKSDVEKVSWSDDTVWV